MTKWIKTSDELPADTQWCAVCVDNVALDVACYDDNHNCWVGCNFSYNQYEISYWLALPPLPIPEVE